MTDAAAIPRARQARGEKRRTQILEATLRLIAREGVGGVTHRAVAAEAEVPLAATTYYFSSKQELLVEAFRLHVDGVLEGVERLERAEPWADISPEDAAALVAQVLLDDLSARRDTLVAEYELVLEAGRDPHLRRILRASRGAIDAHIEEIARALGSSHPHEDTRIVTALIAGLELQQVADPENPLTRDDLEPILRRLFAALLRQPPHA